jgi:hypothetical protein
MITPKEKAEELVDKYIKASFNCTDCVMTYCDIRCTMLSLTEAKDCAIIAIDEIIKFGNEQGIREPMMYWYKVKEELEKL